MWQKAIICDSCSRLDRYSNQPSDEVPQTCSSFPMGIPRDIYFGGADHRVSRAGEEPHELLEGYEDTLEFYEREKEAGA